MDEKYEVDYETLEQAQARLDKLKEEPSLHYKLTMAELRADKAEEECLKLKRCLKETLNQLELMGNHIVYVKVHGKKMQHEWDRIVETLTEVEDL